MSDTLTVMPTSGRFIVETLHSSYVIDTDARTFERQPVHADANPLGVISGRVVSYDLISPVEVGESISISAGLGAWLRSTPVVSIVAAP